MYMLWKFLKTSISQMYFLYLRSHNTIFLFFGQFCLKPIFLFFEASPTATLTSSRGIMSTDIITFIAIIITIIITDYWYHYFCYCFYYYSYHCSHYYDYFWYGSHFSHGTFLYFSWYLENSVYLVVLFCLGNQKLCLWCG